MKRSFLDNGCDFCACTVFCMLLVFLSSESAQGQNQLLNWNDNGVNQNELKVQSLLPSGNAATEVDDGDGHIWTKTFIVPVAANATLTVVATPNRTIQEADLPDEWTLTGGTGNGKLSRTISLATPGKYVLKCQCGDSEKETSIYVFSMALVTPAGDPTTTNGAKASGDGQNEFTFDSASPGVLTMNLKASVTPASAAQYVASKVSFEVASIGNAPPVYTQVSSDNQGFLSATATITGLPDQNSAFGLKTANLKFKGNLVQTNPYEVFFLRDANNHPPCQGCSECPNWFYYWRQVCQHEPMQYVNNDQFTGRVPAMTSWSYSVSYNKNLIEIGSQNPGAFSSYGIGEFVSGIDAFANTVIHEQMHIDQITRADALLPTDGNDTFRYGWSWNVHIHNHWSKGPDNQWGTGNVDDDGDGTIDNAIPEPIHLPAIPFEPGQGDDINLSDSLWTNKPASWNWINTTPYNSLRSPIEREAVQASDLAMNEHDKARYDWGKPGKNHQTLNKWDD